MSALGMLDALLQYFLNGFAPRDKVAMYMGYLFVASALGYLFGGLLSGQLYGHFAHLRGDGRLLRGPSAL